MSKVTQNDETGSQVSNLGLWSCGNMSLSNLGSTCDKMLERFQAG